MSFDRSLYENPRPPSKKDGGEQCPPITIEPAVKINYGVVPEIEGVRNDAKTNQGLQFEDARNASVLLRDDLGDDDRRGDRHDRQAPRFRVCGLPVVRDQTEHQGEQRNGPRLCEPRQIGGERNDRPDEQGVHSQTVSDEKVIFPSGGDFVQVKTQHDDNGRAQQKNGDLMLGEQKQGERPHKVELFFRGERPRMPHDFGVWFFEHSGEVGIVEDRRQPLLECDFVPMKIEDDRAHAKKGGPETEEASDIEVGDVDSTRRVMFGLEHAGDDEPGDDEEHIHAEKTARKHVRVIEVNGEHRQRSQSVNPLYTHLP